MSGFFSIPEMDDIQFNDRYRIVHVEDLKQPRTVGSPMVLDKVPEAFVNRLNSNGMMLVLESRAFELINHVRSTKKVPLNQSWLHPKQ